MTWKLLLNGPFPAYEEEVKNTFSGFYESVIKIYIIPPFHAYRFAADDEFLIC